LPAFGDAIAPGIVLAQGIGRLGNYFNQELYGRHTSVPWGLEIFNRRDASGALDSIDGVASGPPVDVVHPTFLYELIWDVLVFVALIYIDHRFKLGHGRLFATYVAGYCIGRFWVELMRDDPATEIAGIRINSFTSTFVFIGAVVYILLAPRGREDPATLRGKPPARLFSLFWKMVPPTVKKAPPTVKKPKEPIKAKAPAVKEPVAAEDKALVEWTKELAAVASTSGVVAGVAVAAGKGTDETAGEGGGGSDDTFINSPIHLRERFLHLNADCLDFGPVSPHERHPDRCNRKCNEGEAPVEQKQRNDHKHKRDGVHPDVDESRIHQLLRLLNVVQYSRNDCSGWIAIEKSMRQPLQMSEQSAPQFEDEAIAGDSRPVTAVVAGDRLQCVKQQ